MSNQNKTRANEFGIPDTLDALTAMLTQCVADNNIGVIYLHDSVEKNRRVISKTKEGEEKCF